MSLFTEGDSDPSVEQKRKYLIPLTVPTIATVPDHKFNQIESIVQWEPVGTVGWWNGPLGQHKLGATLKQFEQFSQAWNSKSNFLWWL